MAKRQMQTSDAANDAAQADKAAADSAAEDGKMPIELTPLAAAQLAAAGAQADYDATAASNVSAEFKAYALEAAQAALDSATATLTALEAVEAQRQARADAEAQAVADSLTLPAALQAQALDKMMEAIAARFNPAPPAAPEAAPDEPAILPALANRKQVGARQAALNVTAAEALAQDGSRAAAAVAFFEAQWLPMLDRSVGVDAGTRYPSIVALAYGAASRADYALLTSMIRQYMRAQNGKYKWGVGNGTASDPWLMAIKMHAPDGEKSHDSLPQKFGGAAAMALHADGLLRLTKLGTANVKWLVRDAAALAQWTGGRVTPETQANVPAAPQTAPDAPAAPRVPIAPDVQANAVTGALTPMPQCRHCETRNAVGRATCKMCGQADWQPEAQA